MFALSFLGILMVAQGLFAKSYRIAGGTETARAITRVPDGGCAVAGWTREGSGVEDIVVLRLNSLGDLEWAKTYSGPGREWCVTDIIFTSDGGFVVAGATDSYGAGGNDILILKLTGYGSLEWARTFGTGTHDYPGSVVQASDGGYAVVGYTTTGHYPVLIKLSSSGEVEWAKEYHVRIIDASESVCQTNDGGYGLAVTADRGGLGATDFLVMKVSVYGDVQWARVIGTGSYDYTHSMTKAGGGGFVISGTTDYFPPNYRDILVVKMDESGNLEWNRLLGLTSSPWKTIQTQEGGYAFVTSNTFVKLTPVGNLEWACSGGGWSLDQATDGGYISAGDDSYDIQVFKFASDGSYPGCLAYNSTTVRNPSLNVISLAISTEDWAMSISDPLLVATTPSIFIEDLCSPLDADEISFGTPAPKLRCSTVPRGLIFNSPAELIINIYSVDGRVAHSGQLQRGTNKITLGRGVYLWIAGPYRGKAVVR